MFESPAVCTYFDHRYLTRGLVLHASLRKHLPNSTLYVLALTEECARSLESLQLEGVHIITLERLEAERPELAEIKKSRSLIEYYFTLSPVLPLYLFENGLVDGELFYLDADGCVYAEFAALSEQLAGASVGITPHRFPEDEKHRESAGRYNVGFQYYSGDAESLKILRWWRDRCYEWCYDQIEKQRYADQKYLERWPELFERVREIDHPGVNAAPWNISRYGLETRGEKIKAITLDDQPLIFYHYQGLRRLSKRLTRTGLEHYRIFESPQATRRVTNWIYRPYIRALIRAEKRIQNSASAALEQTLRYAPEPTSALQKIKHLLRRRIVFSWG